MGKSLWTVAVALLAFCGASARADGVGAETKALADDLEAYRVTADVRRLDAAQARADAMLAKGVPTDGTTVRCFVELSTYFPPELARKYDGAVEAAFAALPEDDAGKKKASAIRAAFANRRKADAAVAALLPAKPRGWGLSARVSARAESLLGQPLCKSPDELYDENGFGGKKNDLSTAHREIPGRITCLASAELAERKGRFIPKLDEYIRLYSRQRAWCNYAYRNSDHYGNPPGKVQFPDLEATHFAAGLGNVLWHLGDRLPPETVRLAKQAIERHIFQPARREIPMYPNQKMGGKGGPGWTHSFLYWIAGHSNWNAVCWNGLVHAALVTLDDPLDRAFFVRGAINSIPDYLAGLTSDGYCFEGPGYWEYGFGHHLRMGLFLREQTGGKLDIFTYPRQRACAEYGWKFALSGELAPPYADARAPSRLTVGDVRANCLKIWPDVGAKPGNFTEYAEAQVWLFRHASGYSLSFKGGTNDEIHNNNDLGTYSVMRNGRLVGGEPGGEVYTARTWSDQRYESPVMGSYGHAVPVVAGAQQKAGRAYAAKLLARDVDGPVKSVTLELKGAYGVKALKTLRRTCRYDTATGEATVTDHVEFTEPSAFEDAYNFFREEDNASLKEENRKYIEWNVRPEVTVVKGGPYEVSEKTLTNPGALTPRRVAITFREKLTEAEVVFRYAIGKPVRDLVRIERTADSVRLFRTGEPVPFAEMASRVPGVDLTFRTERDSPFVFIDFAPSVTAAERIVRRIDLPAMRLFPFDETPKALGTGGLTSVDGHSGSFAFLSVVSPKSRKGVVAAYLTNEKASGVLASGFGRDGRAEIRPFAEYGLMTVRAGAAVKRDTLLVGAFDDCRLGLEASADAVARHYRIRLPKQIAGYTTWYDDEFGYSHRKGAGTAASAKAFADAVAKTRLCDFGFAFYQIDDFWQSGDTTINGPARDFFHVDPKGPFPDGFLGTTRYFADRGVIPGLWIMPFGGLSKERFFADKQDIFATAAEDSAGSGGGARNDSVGIALAQRKGAPFETAWGGTVIDLTKPSARRYVADLTRLVTYDWGFRYIKFDGMWTGHGGDLMGGATWRNDHYDNIVRADPTQTGMEAFRTGVKILRESSAPGTFLLACNSAASARSIAPSFGLVDGMRIGGDNGPIDEFPDRYLAGPIAATPRYFYNGRVWYNDPDPVYVRDAVSRGRARLFASWGGVSGLFYNFSDWLPKLSAERVDLLKRTMAPHGCRACRPVDYFENLTSRVWIVDDGARKVFGLFNWDPQKPLAIDYTAAYAGLDSAKTYVGFDYWANEFVKPFKGTFRFDVPADNCRVLALAEVTGRPVLVSTSRHVASPIFDVKDVAWKGTALEGAIASVAGDRTELRLFVPPPWRVVSAEVADRSAAVSAEGEFVRITFTPPETAAFRWRFRFTR